ncbi:rod shape-determining protein MreC [Planotetraspora kaengkrachanensis]|uniref:Cell shape-determining protein MreC n=1 Tax=Planotetraspora kaengkrachanensis TaxID=575193 RepID=A0A8J3PTD2_9ACTN|nr:rod shape-determining protein MreC [Planotetraspora kaengkrachanensis]GIG80779.1 rod shape-determining protein MreC [Planotetraspora kaengkrachanensis]
MRDTRRARLVIGVLLAAALILITVDHRAANGTLLAPVRDVASSVFGRVEGATATVTGPITGFFKTISNAPGAERAITALRKENAQLKSDLDAQRLNRDRVMKLDRMLGLAGLGRYRIVPAQVVARRASPGFEDAVEIDIGTGDGVRTDMTVLSGDGLVGRVVHAGPSTSTVVLLTDPALAAGARMEGGNELGVVSGLGEAGGNDNLIKFRMLDSSSPVQVGRRIVSFGSQGSAPYVPGVPIGVIERVDTTPGELTRTAYARPFADFSSIDVVGVVTEAPKRDPRDSVLPPVPKPPASRQAKPAERVPASRAPLAPPADTSQAGPRETDRTAEQPAVAGPAADAQQTEPPRSGHEPREETRPSPTPRAAPGQQGQEAGDRRSQDRGA